MGGNVYFLFVKRWKWDSVVGSVSRIQCWATEEFRFHSRQYLKQLSIKNSKLALRSKRSLIHWAQGGAFPWGQRDRRAKVDHLTLSIVNVIGLTCLTRNW